MTRLNATFRAYIDVKTENHAETIAHIEKALGQGDYAVDDYIHSEEDFEDFVRVYFDDPDDACKGMNAFWDYNTKD